MITPINGRNELILYTYSTAWKINKLPTTYELKTAITKANLKNNPEFIPIYPGTKSWATPPSKLKCSRWITKKTEISCKDFSNAKYILNKTKHKIPKD